MKLLMLFLVIGASFADHSDTHNQILDSFMTKPTKELFKVYHFIYKSSDYEINSEEGLKRYVIFKKNLQKIKEHNAKGLSWTEGINYFTDFTDQELNEKFLMKDQEVDQERAYYNKFDLDSYDDSEDENQNQVKGKIPPIDHRRCQLPPRNQGQCGSCWSFTVARAVETNHCLKNGVAPFYLSTQQSVDCNKFTGGCNGGSAQGGFKYIKDASGLVRDSEYPYTGKAGTCDANKLNGEKFGINDFVSIRAPTLEAWTENLALGAMYVRVDGSTLYSYRSGIIEFSKSTKKCNGTNHAVTATGFGYDEKDRPYVLIGNSWGTTWGEKGYFRAYHEINEKNTCFLTAYGYRPPCNNSDK